MATETQISNIAISHLGIGLEIQNLETENSAEARACRRFYETSRDAVLGDFEWPFATKIIELNLVEEGPNTEWYYSYRYPSDCQNFRRILPEKNINADAFLLPGQAVARGRRVETRQSRVPYRIAKDDTGKLIFTDMESAISEYTERVVDTNFYPPDFVLALSYRLAMYIAPSITKGDPFKIQKDLLEMYMLEVSKAEANALNENQDDIEPESEFIRGRE